MSAQRFIFPAILILAGLIACTPKTKKGNEDAQVLRDSLVHEPEYLYGFNLDSFDFQMDTVRRRETFSHLLLPHGVSQGKINQVVEQFRDTFNFNRVNPGRPYVLLTEKKSDDSLAEPRYLIYVQDKIEYVVLDLKDSMDLSVRHKEIQLVERSVMGIIEKGSSFSAVLNDSLDDFGLSNEIEDDITNIYAWTVDFWSIQPGDRFKILFTQREVDGEVIGLEDISAVYFQNVGVDYYGVRFEQDGDIGFFDERTKNLKKVFLKAPIKYTRISSGYGYRFHPVQKRYKAHLGTDYAAPRGTPIWAVGDGTILEARYKKYNGNYVKIRHNGNISTQYLHMSRIAKGMRSGKKVKQGEVIGYVGSTGLANGPHVCFRYWKNGKQTNHRKEKFDSADPIKEENLDAFLKVRDREKKRLDALKFPVEKEEVIPVDSTLVAGNFPRS